MNSALEKTDAHIFLNHVLPDLKLAEGLKINEFTTKFLIIVHKNSSFLGRRDVVFVVMLTLHTSIHTGFRPVCDRCVYVCVPL